MSSSAHSFSSSSSSNSNNSSSSPSSSNRRAYQSQFIELNIDMIQDSSPLYLLPNNSLRDSGQDFELAKVEAEKLPYHKEISAEDQPSRISQYLLLARGDTISPQNIFENGGFHPHAVITGKYKLPKWILDSRSHRITSEKSGYVSFTRSLRATQRFVGSSGVGHVYLAQAAGAIPPNEIAYHENEYSIPGGIDSEEIIAFRAIKDSASMRSFNGSALQIRQAFIEKHPELVEKILNFYMQPNEHLSQESIKKLISICAYQKNAYMKQSHETKNTQQQVSANSPAIATKSGIPSVAEEETTLSMNRHSSSSAAPVSSSASSDSFLPSTHDAKKPREPSFFAKLAEKDKAEKEADKKEQEKSVTQNSHANSSSKPGYP